MDEPWDWTNTLGLQVLRANLEAFEIAGTVSYPLADKSAMFGGAGTGSSISSKPEFRYFTTTYVPASPEIIPILTNRWKANYKSAAESGFAASDTAF